MIKVLGWAQAVIEWAFALPVLGAWIDFVSLIAASSARFGCGGFVAGGISDCRRPQKVLILYEFEGCPFCRYVREAISVLDLDVLVKPCPRTTFRRYQSTDGSRFRPEVMKMGGQAMFPFLVDDNTNTQLYESREIVKYLIATYGDRASLPWSFRLAFSPIFKWTTFLATAVRPLNRHGILAHPSKLPTVSFKPLVLWGYEGSPFVKRVKEALAVLELEYLQKSCPRFSSPSRKEFKRRFYDQLSSVRQAAGLIQVPLLEDPNTGRVVMESADVVAYLFGTYSSGEEGPTESLGDYTTEGSTAKHGSLAFLGVR